MSDNPFAPRLGSNLSIAAIRDPRMRRIVERTFPNFDARDTGPNEVETLMLLAYNKGREDADNNPRQPDNYG